MVTWTRMIILEMVIFEHNVYIQGKLKFPGIREREEPKMIF